jgi:hypothetical protein
MWHDPRHRTGRGNRYEASAYVWPLGRCGRLLNDELRNRSRCSIRCGRIARANFLGAHRSRSFPQASCRLPHRSLVGYNHSVSALRTSIATLIAMLIATISLMLIATMLTTGIRPHSVNVRDDQSIKFRVCLIRIPRCPSLYQPPAPCLLSSIDRCPADGQFGLIDPALR